VEGVESRTQRQKKEKKRKDTENKKSKRATSDSDDKTTEEIKHENGSLVRDEILRTLLLGTDRGI
jgi:hypothetical protein